jgi:hypothetical protein
MRANHLKIAVLTASLLTPMELNAAPVTQAQIAAAQGAMGHRIDAALIVYATKIGIDPSYIGYCTTELLRVTEVLPVNGAIPFGVNYHEITDSQALAIVISTRENYERSFQILCLANAKAALRAANQK